MATSGRGILKRLIVRVTDGCSTVRHPWRRSSSQCSMKLCVMSTSVPRVNLPHHVHRYRSRREQISRYRKSHAWEKLWKLNGPTLSISSLEESSLPHRAAHQPAPERTPFVNARVPQVRSGYASVRMSGSGVKMNGLGVTVSATRG